MFIVLTNQPTKQQPNNNQQPPIPANNNQQHPTTNNNTKHTTPPPKGGFPLLYFHPGRLPGWSGSEQSRCRLQRNHTWQGGIPPIHPAVFSTLGGCQGGVDQSNPEADCKENHTWQGGFPPSQLHFPPWEAARVEWIRAIQRQIARKITPGRVDSSYCILPIPILHKSQFFPYFCLGTGHSVTLQPLWTSPLFPTHLTHCATL